MRWRVVIAFALIACAAFAALLLYNHRIKREVQSQLYIPKRARITPEIELLRQYIRIDTTNPPGRELAGAQFLDGILKKNGIRAEIIESAPGRASIYARIRGRTPGEGLLLLHHIDVVPAPPQGWTRPPFAADIAFNQLWGRGSLDMKGIAIPQLVAFIDVARSGRTPERDIILLGVADEETGGKLGMQWLLEHRPELFDGIRYVFNEGGITETRQERLTYFGVEIGTKMLVKVRLRAPTRERMQQVRIVLEPFITPPDPDRVLPEVREFFHDIAPHRIQQRQYLEDVTRTIAADKFWLLERGYKELMQNVVWPGRVDSDSRGATMEVALFNLPDQDPDARIAWLRDVVSAHGASIEEVLAKNGPAPLTSLHTPLFHLIEREVHREYGDVTVGPEILAGWANDSRFLRAKGITCYGVWPFPVDFFQSQGIHGIDERVRLDWFMQGVRLMRRLMQSYAFETLPATH
jgi:acetylornithine deacetylase/succinyl-diaminopimelate desuccinylase-like protein